jgi:ketosteroid isomerase-like protein
MATDMVSQTSSPLAALLTAFFETKTSCDVDGTMDHFAPDMATYIDATLGWDLDSYEALQSTFREYMPNWAPPARSYATQILSNETSALIRMVDTPELFGGELRILAAVDFADGKIVRWVDYWDSSSFDDDLYLQFRTPAEHFPTDLKDGDVATQATPDLVETATRLQNAFAGADASAAAALLHTDVVLEDMALRVQVLGRIETMAYLDRALDHAPYGRSSTLRHVVGGSNGGGFEWTADAAAGSLVGITALERDGDGLVTRITSVYDSRQLAPDRSAALRGASFAT